MERKSGITGILSTDTMLLMTKETLVPISDLRYVSIECADSKCKTVVTIDLDLDFSEKPTPDFTFPFQCPACKQNYNLRDSIKDLWKSYRAMSQHHTKVSFRLKE